MANPNNAVGTNGAFGGRTSVNAFNDVLSAFSGRGIVSGWACSPSSGLTVNLGGNGTDRDVAVAEDASGNKTTVNNISESPIPVTLNAAPASNSRIDAVVAYIEDSPSGDGETDNPDVVNILVVSGSVASTPSRPTDNTIRTAITGDGASGSTAYYVVLAYVTIPTGTTDVDASMISAGESVTLTVPLGDDVVSADNIVNGAITPSAVDFSSFKAMPFPVIKAAVEAGFGMTMQLMRVGNLVLANGTNVATLGKYDQNVIAETVPSGYRPRSTDSSAYVPFVSTTNTGGYIGSWTINSNGSLALSHNETSSNPERYMYNGCWLTNDAWPS